MESYGQAVIKDRALKSIEGRHPWVYSGAIDKMVGNPGSGDIVDVVDSNGELLGRGFFNPTSKIAVRILTFEDIECGPDLLYRRIKRAIDHRKAIPEYGKSDAWRLAFAESDSLPGLVADYYAGFVNVQFHSAGWERLKVDTAKMIFELTGCRGIYDGSDRDIRTKEGLETENKTLLGSDPPDYIRISEFGRFFEVDIRHGQKSGIYLDQKFNHQDAVRYAGKRRVLDAFSYTGGFGIAALEGGCSSLKCIEISADATGILDENIRTNGYHHAPVEVITGNAFAVMRSLLSQQAQFDMVILDPPAFCRSRSAVVKACRGYKDINRLAMQLLSPAGILVTCSCSKPVPDELFLQVLWQASVEAGREAKMIQLGGQPPDHPVLLTFPESKYLKCVTLIVD